MTNANRFIRKLTDDPRCFVCGEVEENIEHIIRRCPVATLVWRKFPGTNDYEIFGRSFNDWVVSNMSNDNSRDEEWPMVFATTLWWLWKWRSMRVFDRVVEIPVDQLGFIMARVEMNRQAWQREEKVEGRGNKPCREVYVRWEYPREGWVKLNTDGASKGNPGMAGAGGIIRGARGEVIGMYAANCGATTCTRAEFLAVLRGLALTWNKGCRKVVLEVDSMVVVRELLGDLRPSSPLYHIVRRCKGLIFDQEWEVVVKHCYREANRAADWLANYGVGLNPKLVIMEAAPMGLRDVLLEDLSGVALLRKVPTVAA